MKSVLMAPYPPRWNHMRLYTYVNFAFNPRSPKERDAALGFDHVSEQGEQGECSPSELVGSPDITSNST